MLNGDLIELLKKHPLDKVVKIRHRILTLADIDDVTTASFCKDIKDTPEEVIVIDNEELSKEGYK